MTTLTLRLVLWTVLAVIACVGSLWALYRSEQKWRAGRSAPSGVRWVLRARFGASLLMVAIWIGVIAVGLLGFDPTLFEYRGWVMLLVVIELAAYQLWDIVAWGRIEQNAEQGISHAD